MAGNDSELKKLFQAVENNDCEAIKALLAQGLKVNVRRNGETPLYVASRNGFIEAVKLLLAEGAKVDARDYLGQTPLDQAIMKGHKNVEEFLLASGAQKGDIKNNNIWDAAKRSSPVHSGRNSPNTIYTGKEEESSDDDSSTFYDSDPDDDYDDEKRMWKLLNLEFELSNSEKELYFNITDEEVEQMERDIAAFEEMQKQKALEESKKQEELNSKNGENSSPPRMGHRTL